MENPLNTLDEIIFNACGKVTKYANQKLGWNKWDLVQICDYATSVFFVGVGFYDSLAHYDLLADNLLHPVSLVFDVVCIGLGVYKFYFSKRYNQKKEQEEFDNLSNFGATEIKTTKPLRPLEFGLSIFIMGLGISKLISPEHLNQHLSAQYLCMAMVGGVYASASLASYFKDQFMSPPSKKKSLWASIFNYITSPLERLRQPKPVKVPVPIEYGHIDNYTLNPVLSLS